MSDLLQLLQKNHPGYHPLTSLLELSKHPDATIRDKQTCHSEAAKFILPKLRTLLSTGEITSNSIIRIVVERGE